VETEKAVAMMEEIATIELRPVESQRRNASPGPRSFAALVWQKVAARGQATALRKKDRGIWKAITWHELGDRTRQVGMGLAALGIRAGDVACVLSETNPEWVYADLGILGIGAICAGIYPTSAPAQVEYVLRDCDARVLFVEDEEQLDKALEVRERCPALMQIVIFDMEGLRGLDDPMCESFEAFLARGAAHDRAYPGAWEAAIAAVETDWIANLVYTSGTTGPPKGAMLSHRNILAQVESSAAILDFREGDERLAFLPMCHVAEQVGLYQALARGAVSNYLESPETFAENLRELRPTVFLGVPRVWEKFHSRITLAVGDATWLQRAFYHWAIAAGERRARARLAGRKRAPWLVLEAWLASVLVLRHVRQELGLDRVRLAVVGAAPISPDLIRWFLAIGIELIEVYGQTECTGVATANVSGQVRPGTVGRAIPGFDIRLSPEGEILLRSECVFMGYWRRPEKTAETIRDGWLHTGDIGRLADGYLSITDRMRDIIITAGGKNITPSEIENQLKFSPYIADAIVIGDRRRFLSCLIMIDQENVEKWAQDRGVPFSNFASLTRAESVRELIAGEVARANAKFARAEQVRAFRLIEQKLEPEDPELTPTMKLKRQFVQQKYAELIATMYNEA
jgi:long-chain acyl-CoA synthetase